MKLSAITVLEDVLRETAIRVRGGDAERCLEVLALPEDVAVRIREAVRRIETGQYTPGDGIRSILGCLRLKVATGEMTKPDAQVALIAVCGAQAEDHDFLAGDS